MGRFVLFNMGRAETKIWPKHIVGSMNRFQPLHAGLLNISTASTAVFISGRWMMMFESNIVDPQSGCKVKHENASGQSDAFCHRISTAERNFPVLPQLTGAWNSWPLVNLQKMAILMQRLSWSKETKVRWNYSTSVKSPFFVAVLIPSASLSRWSNSLFTAVLGRVMTIVAELGLPWKLQFQNDTKNSSWAWKLLKYLTSNYSTTHQWAKNI